MPKNAVVLYMVVRRTADCCTSQPHFTLPRRSLIQIQSTSSVAKQHWDPAFGMQSFYLDGDRHAAVYSMRHTAATCASACESFWATVSRDHATVACRLFSLQVTLACDSAQPMEDLDNRTTPQRHPTSERIPSVSQACPQCRAHQPCRCNSLVPTRKLPRTKPHPRVGMWQN